MKPTRALLDGVMKYKKLFGDFPECPDNHFLYDEQVGVLKFVAGPMDLQTFQHLKSIECQIMDWADDIAYGLGDLVDGVRARFITVERLERWARDQSAMVHSEVEQLAREIRSGTVTRFAAITIGKFIEACSLAVSNTPLAGSSARYKFDLIKHADAERGNSVYRKIAPALIFGTAQVQQLEYKGAHMLERLFEVFLAEYCSLRNSDRLPNLLPNDLEARILAISSDVVAGRARLICDHLSGMSDDFAARTYRRLFDADYGSIVDLV